MKGSTGTFAKLVLVFTTCPYGLLATDNAVTPIAKVVRLLINLQGEVIAEGNTEQALYDKFTSWCGTTSSQTLFEIEGDKRSKQDLEARIKKAITDDEDAKEEVQRLTGSLATNTNDLRAIKLIRKKEKEDFEALDLEITKALRMLDVAANAILRTKPSAFLQKDQPTQGLKDFTAALGSIVDATGGMSVDDRSRLEFLLQMHEQGMSSDAEDDSDDDDDEDKQEQKQKRQRQRPVYSWKGDDVLDVLKEMEEKEEENQRSVRAKENQDIHEYQKMKLQLTTRVDTETKELEAAKKTAAKAQEVRAETEGKLRVVTKSLEENEEAISQLQSDCMSRATEFQTEVADRKAEMESLTAARKRLEEVVQEASSGSSAIQTSESAPSLLQVKAYDHHQADSLVKTMKAAKKYHVKGPSVKVLHMLKAMAKADKSAALMQLSSRVAAAIRYSAAAGADPLAKVKTMIENLVEKLQEEIAEDDTLKAFCDKEMTETETSIGEHGETIETLTNSIELKEAAAQTLRQEIAMLTYEVGKLQKSMDEAAKLRDEEQQAYFKASKEYKDSGLAVQTAVKVLKEYYTTGSASSFMQDEGTSMRATLRGGAPSRGNALIGLLETIGAALSKNLAEAEAAEDSAVEKYNQIRTTDMATKSSKQSNLRTKQRSASSLDRELSQLKGDRGEKSDELTAMKEYYERLRPQCVNEESFTDRVMSRNKEISGLHEALQYLER